MLAGALGQEVVANLRATVDIGAIGASQEKAVPSLTDGSDDALVPPGANVYLVDTLRQAHVQGKPDGLGAIVDKNSTDGHFDPLTNMYMAIVYCTFSAMVATMNHKIEFII
jgi:hypothetical protein